MASTPVGQSYRSCQVNKKSSSSSSSSSEDSVSDVAKKCFSSKMTQNHKIIKAFSVLIMYGSVFYASSSKNIIEIALALLIGGLAGAYASRSMQ